MPILLAALCIFVCAGILSFLAANNRLANNIGATGAILGSALALWPAAAPLVAAILPVNIAIPAFSLPIGAFLFHMDALSSVFLVPALVAGALCAFYAHTTLPTRSAQANLSLHWFFYNILLAAVVLVFTAADAFFFLFSWELMSLSPFLLIALHDEKKSVRAGMWAYLIAAHIGVLFLLAFFVLLSTQSAGSLAFTEFIRHNTNFTHKGLLFLLAFTGFGIKAGIFPFHIWLPRAYAAAPGHIAALMSAAVTTTGIYGIIRSLELLGAASSWWAFVLIGAGAISMTGGITFALVQGSIKRALAYSSVENMGIVCFALGFSLYAHQAGHSLAAVFCYLGALLHMSNHSLYKPMLFLLTGSVAHAAGSDKLHMLGGLQKRMPFAGLCFALGAAAICALPPFNGFAGEFIIYLALSLGGADAPANELLYWGGLFIMAAAGGLAMFCFIRLYSITFSGNPRSQEAAQALTPSRKELHAPAILLILCVVSAVAAPWFIRLGQATLAPFGLAPTGAEQGLANQILMGASSYLAHATPPLGKVSALTTAFGVQGGDALNTLVRLLCDVNFAALVFVGLITLCVLWRKRLLARQGSVISPTWDCGYSTPTARIQYTAGSFAQPATECLRTLLQPHIEEPEIVQYFPQRARLRVRFADWVSTGIYAPLWQRCLYVTHKAKLLQHGRSNGYILYILITLVTLLAWKVR